MNLGGSNQLEDRWGRQITYLRASLTDRCNFACQYCSPEEGTPHADRPNQLTVDQYLRLFTLFGQAGIQHIRLTGGEPLIYPKLADLLARLPACGVPTWSISTNGVLLPRWAERLRLAGIRKVNVSVDSLEEQRFFALTRGGKISQVLRGVEAALAAGFSQVAINVVLYDSQTLEEAPKLAAHFLPMGAQLRFIETMPLGAAGVQSLQSQRITAEEVQNVLMDHYGSLEELASEPHHGPARYYRFSRWTGTVGFIAPWTANFCAHCNRVRLTAEGHLRYCLGQEQGMDLRVLLQKGIADTDLIQAIQGGIAEDKPEHHYFQENLQLSKRVYMMQVGG